MRYLYVYTCRYSNVHFVNLKELSSSPIPLDCLQFEVTVREQCSRARNIFMKELVDIETGS